MGYADRLSLIELTQRILEMSETGIYRESIFEVFHSFATKQDVRRAIAQAKKFGLYSVASLRDTNLGTYYQLDLQVYQKRKHHIGDIAREATEKRQLPGRQRKAVNATNTGSAVTSSTVTASTVQDMLSIVRALTGLLILISLSLGVSGHPYLAGIGLYGAVGTGMTWQLQRLLVQRRQPTALEKALNHRG